MIEFKHEIATANIPNPYIAYGNSNILTEDQLKDIADQCEDMVYEDGKLYFVKQVDLQFS